MHPLSLPDAEFMKEVRLESSRGSGPGGQHRNTSETQVTAVHVPTGIRAQAGERRSLSANRARALERLRRKLALEHRVPLERFSAEGCYEPSVLWRSRLQGGRIVVSVRHRDFPAVLAEALDVLEAMALDGKRAAAALGITTAQLVRLFARDPAVLARVNERLRSHGRKTFHR